VQICNSRKVCTSACVACRYCRSRTVSLHNEPAEQRQLYRRRQTTCSVSVCSLPVLPTHKDEGGRTGCSCWQSHVGSNAPLCQQQQLPKTARWVHLLLSNVPPTRNVHRTQLRRLVAGAGVHVAHPDKGATLSPASVLVHRVRRPPRQMYRQR
jgi:hypothetical protein